MTPLSARKVKPAAADVQAEEPDEPDLRAGMRKGLCCNLKGLNTLKGIKAKTLKRVFNIDVSVCSACGGPMKIIASIEDPMVIGEIVSQLEATSYAPPAGSAKCAVEAHAAPPGVC